MGNYRVSYKILRQQGDELKAIAKLVDDYAQRTNQIVGRLGEDQMLQEVRGNLRKLSTQLGESRAVLNTAGELLLKTVDGYTAVETRQVKKTGGLKAHNRDFYKNPVVVVSAGAAGAATGLTAAASANSAGAAASDSAGMTVNYTDNSTTVHVTEFSAQAQPAAGGSQSLHAAPVSAASIPGGGAAPAAAAGGMNDLQRAGIAAGAGLAGGVLGGIGVQATVHAKKRRDTKNTARSDDLDARLEQAREKVRRLDEEQDDQGEA